MGDFSAGAAIGAGFRLIGREPLAFAAWCVVTLVLGVLPQGWVMAELFRNFGSFAELAAKGDETADTGAIFAMQARMMQLQPISYLSSILSGTLVGAAILRAVLRPAERAYAFLRLGMRELWLGLVVLVLVVMLFIGSFILMIPLMIVMAVAAATKSEVATVLGFLLMLVAFGVAIWVALRASMAPVMSFARNNFLLFESWSFTRGHALKMFGVALALAVFIWVVEIVLAGAGFAAVAAQIPLRNLFDPDAPNPFAKLADLGVGFWAAIAVVAAVFSTFSKVLFGGAWAEIYRGLDQVAPVEPANGDGVQVETQ